MNYPYLLQLETMSGCNAKCTICGMRKMTRPLGKMDWSLFTKIIQDVKELPIHTIVPFINGEPLLDNRMLDILKYIKIVLPNVEIGWYTNGQLITREIIRRMAGIGNVKTFNISIHGGTKEVYEKSMCLNWENLLCKLEILVSENKLLGSPFVIKAQCCDFSLTHSSLNSFKNLCSTYNIDSCVGCYSNFGGLMPDEVGEAKTKNLPNKVCQRAQSHLYVLNNGDVVSCCFDVNCVNHLGNAKNNSLKEIWENPESTGFREKHLRLDYSTLDFCSKCNAKKFGG